MISSTPLHADKWQDEAATAPLTEIEHIEIDELMRELRKIKRDRLFVPVARLQLMHLLSTADQLIENDPDKAREVRKFARGVAFNIASFTWPGWDDNGPISQERQALGYSAARVGFEIAQKIDDVTPNILWILGAHQLNAQEYQFAATSFVHGSELAKEEIGKAMQLAWVALTHYLESTSDENEQTLAAALAVLAKIEHEDAQFFVDQLNTAKKVFLAAKN